MRCNSGKTLLPWKVNWGAFCCAAAMLQNSSCTHHSTWGLQHTTPASSCSHSSSTGTLAFFTCLADFQLEVIKFLINFTGTHHLWHSFMNKVIQDSTAYGIFFPSFCMVTFHYRGQLGWLIHLKSNKQTNKQLLQTYIRKFYIVLYHKV